MSNIRSIKAGDCFQINGQSFAIAETLSGYTLYQSVSCQTPLEGKAEWEAAGGEVPSGWKQCSDAIPSDTIHLVYDVIPGTTFYLKDCSDKTIKILSQI